tara:strand:+ start:1279 stop:1473 length:195 start_codon:yes stop_codon:yes gene_type:complete
MIKIKNKVARKILGIITLGIGGWFVFEFVRNLLEPFIPLGLAQLVIGSLLVLIGVKFFGLTGGK